MAYTGHGHHIPGTVKGEISPSRVARCGGVKICRRCKAEVESSWSYLHPKDEEDFPEKAKRIVREYVSEQFKKISVEGAPPVPFDVKLVWFVKTLKTWKAIVITTLPDNIIYEVSYDGANRLTYLDEYLKQNQRIIPDLEQQ